MLYDLPLHPLLVHAPVVLLPLTALGVVVLAFQKRRVPQVALCLLGLVVVAVLATAAALLSGNYLASVTFLPETHQRWGVFLTIASVLYLLVAAPWLWRVSREGDQPGKATRAWGFASAVVAVLVTGLTVLAGHSGAQLAWSGVGGDASAEPASSGSATASPSGTTGAAAIAMDDISQHNTPEDCWAAIDGNAYDLTDWVSRHPGGSAAIAGICGTDATAAFDDQHGGESEPAAALEEYLLGPVS